MRYRHIVRRLARTPAFTLISALTLALGIGANTAIFSVIEGVLLKPLPYPHPEQLVGLRCAAPRLNLRDAEMAPFLYVTYREQNRVFQDVGLWNSDSGTLTGRGQPEQTPALDVTEGILSMLGAQPVVGRLFSPDDTKAGSPQTVVLTYGFWQSHFGGSPSAVGQNLIVDAKPRLIIGVLPQTFHFLDSKAQIVLPMQLNRANIQLGNFSFSSIARLRPGITIDQANADAARMMPIALSAFPAPGGFSKSMFSEVGLAPVTHPLLREVTGDIGESLWAIMGTIGIVLLIACANVANLLLVRAGGREQELAVRAALGASWSAIARELMLESLTIGLFGGALGLALAFGGLRLLMSIAPANLPRLHDIGIDAPVLLFTLVISIAAGAFFGIIPVLKYATPQLVSSLRGGGRGASQSRERQRARRVLVVAQVALATVLLIAAGLTIRSFQALHNIQPGFAHAEQLQTFRIFIPPPSVKDPVMVARQQEEILTRVRAVAGVSGAGLMTILPLDGGGWHDPIYAQDKTYTESMLPGLRQFKFISPGALAAMGTPLVAGRDFDWIDVDQMRPVALVSENVARDLWRTPAAAIGKRIRPDRKTAWREVIGVVADVHDDGVDQAASQDVYWPFLTPSFGPADENKFIARGAAVIVRSQRAGTESFVQEIRRAVWSVNPDLPLDKMRTMAEIYQRSLARTSFTLVMLAIAGAMALLLGMVGLYGTISYSVSQRTREIGIRMAMGARRGVLTGMFLRYGLTLSIVGVACGIAGAAVVTRAMKSLLFEVKPLDPITYIAAPLALVAAAALASYLPALRATAVDPLEALRAE
jgi:predicted permease